METSYMFADIHDLSPIFTPLRTTQRIKYTCFSVSQNFLVFGASSGGLYVFRREPCSFLQLLPNQEGAIVHVAISPDEKLFTFASVKGVVCVLERNSSGLGARRIFTSNEHIGINVTALLWNGQSNELFIGDQVGKVSIISLLPFMMKNMFNPPSCTLMVLDSQIVQMDWQADLLLVSTLTRSYICDVIKERFRQIGMKPRDGEYGSCFFVCGDLPVKTQIKTEAVGGRFISVGEGEKIGGSEELQSIKVFCARPGSRLWEVKIDGTVLNTHQFKQALAIPPTVMIKVPQSTDSSQERDNEPSKSTNNVGDVIWNNQSFNFCKLFILSKKFLFTFKRDGIYVFDPEKASVVMWSNDVSDIIDAQVVKDTIYLRNSSGHMFGILFTPLQKFLIRLYLRKQYSLCAKLCEIHSQYLMKEVPSSSKLYLLADLGTKLSNDEVTHRILPLLQEISKCAQETRSAQRLESGIFVVENRHFLSKEEIETSIPDLPQVRRAERLKDKSRSLSVSPDRSRRKKKIDIVIGNSGTQRSDSSSSLPELGNSRDKSSSRSAGDTKSDNRINFKKQKSDNSENHSSLGMKKSFSKELFTSFDTSPETIQALKEIGQSVSSKITSSTKTLKEKWQVLEGKILGSEAPPELLDIKTSDYVEKSEINDRFKKSEEEIVFSDKSKTEKSFGKQRFEPNIDVNNVMFVLEQYHSSRGEENEQSKLTFKLWSEILVMYNNYMYVKINSQNVESTEDVSDSQKSINEDNLKATIKYFAVDWFDKPFPFEEYFSAEVVKDLSLIFHHSLRTKILIEWLQGFIPVMECKVSLRQILDIYPLEAVHLDILLSRFLIVCSDLLDPHCILQCIKESAISCYYATFCTVLDKYQAGVLQQVGKEKSVESSCWQWPLPLRLNAMFFMLQMNQIETCYMMGSNIDLQEVWYLTLRLQQLEQHGNENDLDDSRSYTIFLTYLDRATDTDLVMQSLLKNEYLISITAAAFENVNKGLGASCKCGFPFPVGTVAQVHFNEIGRILSNHLWLTNHDRHQQLCEQVPILWKQMLRNTPSDNLKSVLPLLVQLGDFSVLKPLLSCMTPDLWKQVLDMTATVRSGQCLKCGLQSLPSTVAYTVSLSDVGALLVKSLGANTALDLLSKHSTSSGHGALDERFYKSCIFSTIIDSYSDDLRADAVDLALASAESPSKKPLVSNEFGKLLEEALALDLSKVTVSAADPDCINHHWGAQVDLRVDPCPCCSLPLGSPGLLQDTGLMIFQCGHAFHAVCLCQRPVPTATCLLCSQGS